MLKSTRFLDFILWSFPHEILGYDIIKTDNVGMHKT